MELFHFHETSGIELKEALDKEGKEWEVILIEEGVSLNGIDYPAEVLEKSVHLFDEIPSNAIEFIAKGTKEYDHLPEDAKRVASGGVVKNIVGFFKKPRFKDTGNGKRGIVARFHIPENAKWLRQLLLEAFKKGVKKLLGFSIDAYGKTVPAEVGGLSVQRAESIVRVDSVDVVSHPAAGGGFESLIASIKNYHGGLTMELKEKILRLVEAIDKSLLEGKDVEKLTEADAHSLLRKIAEEFQAETMEAKTFKATLRNLIELVKADKENEAIDLIEALLENKGLSTAKKKKTPEEEEKEKQEAKKKKAAEEEKEAKKKKAEEEEEEAKRKKKYGEFAEGIGKQLDNLNAKLEEQQKKTALAESKNLLESRLKESNFDIATMDEIRIEFTDRIFGEDEIKAGFDRKEKYLSRLMESGKVVGMGARVETGDDFKDRIGIAMDGMLDGQDLKCRLGEESSQGKTKVPKFRSLREAYRVIAHVSGEINAQAVLAQSSFFTPISSRVGSFWSPEDKSAFDGLRRMMESLKTSDFAEILGDSITRKMIKEYSLEDLRAWEKLVSDKVPVNDFRTQRRMQIGGYGTLSVVPEQSNYPELASPTDRESTYSPSKYGGLESLTIEMIADDDVKALRMIPIRMGRGAARTLFKTLLDALANNLEQDASTPIADNSTRLNYTTTALSGAELSVIRRSMREKTGYGDTSEVLGEVNLPKFLLVPPELEELAFKLSKDDHYVNPAFDSGTEIAASAPNIHKGIEPIVVSYWTDENDYWVVADPAKVPTIEVGFYQGREEPELFIQDQVNVGSVFTADKITYKIRHIWGWGILDWRPFHYAEVA